ncbi:MAG TPA: CBS domain-containing protein [Methylomirabilota bacterium]|jgi:CBS domain-containing protein|nr:CBS domain-containing protein [Methylomirabilota bacterium]
MNIASLLASKGSRVITIQSGETVRYAVALLAEHNIGALVVVDRAARPVGIVSERDIVRAAAKNEQVFATSIVSIMTRDVVIGVPHDDLASVGHTMTERRIRHLPVMDSSQLIGIVSIGDIVKAQRDQYEGELETLQTQLLGDR